MCYKCMANNWLECFSANCECRLIHKRYTVLLQNFKMSQNLFTCCEAWWRQKKVNSSSSYKNTVSLCHLFIVITNEVLLSTGRWSHMQEKLLCSCLWGYATNYHHTFACSMFLSHLNTLYFNALLHSWISTPN